MDTLDTREGMHTSAHDTDMASLTTLRLGEYVVPTATGRCLLSQHTDREVVVYQAYKPELGLFAAEHGYFGGGFSYARTSWIKPNFTWMAHRCGWASKQNQEVVLALHLRRDYWDSVLSQAVMSNYESHRSTQPEESSLQRGSLQRHWKSLLRASDVVMQWDPDHEPFTGHKTSHRVIQLGLRRDALAAFRGPAFAEGGIEDVTAFIKATAAKHGGEGDGALDGMLLPVEEPYVVRDPLVAQRLGID